MKIVINGYKIFVYNKRANMITMISLMESQDLEICL